MAPLLSCGGKAPGTLGGTGRSLSPCPASPNCVSSDAADNAHQVPPLVLAVSPEKAWPALRMAVSSLPRTTIVDDSGQYLHAECRSAVFRFVDDLELHLRPDEGAIAVRSASRLGYSDFGVNRGRVETLRRKLVSAGVVKP
ncbi:MAG TPA: DUF1499 domain-containing protein [Deltaproteobacteria bacterium]|nr:DUF1499 domain-containing protein [Deltaproteobacteria bacterium]